MAFRARRGCTESRSSIRACRHTNQRLSLPPWCTRAGAVAREGQAARRARFAGWLASSSDAGRDVETD